MVSLQSAEEKLRRVAKDNGILVRRFKDINSLPKKQTYTGRTIQLVRHSTAEFLQDLAHELGHFFVAPDEFKHVRDFGWGMSYEMYPSDERRRDYDSSEEERASLLGIWIVKEVLGNESSIEVLEEHGWNRAESSWKVMTVTSELIQDGHLVWKNNRIAPTCLVA